MRMGHALMCALLVGCGGLGGNGKNKNPGDDDPTGGPTTETDPQTTPAGCPGCTEVAPSSRFARMTHLQWENTVADLLRLDQPTDISDTFIGDGISDGFGNNAEALEVSAELWQDYQRAAEELAAMVVADADIYSGVVPQDVRTGSGGVPFDDRVQAEDPSVFATTGAPGGSDYNLWSTGELSATFDIPAQGVFTIAARVWADQAGPDLAQATLGVDGTDLVVTDIVAASEGAAEILEADLELTPGNHTVHVGFLNDYYDPGSGQDRNLHIDWLEITGSSGSLGESTAGDSERDAWIEDFGSRAYRRPLTADEVALYTDLFAQGPDLVATGDDFADGVQVVLEAILQAPFFLYRAEESVMLVDERIPLSSYELASKLSFALWNSMPDDELFDRAADGSLSDPTVLRAQAQRLFDLADKSEGAFDDFHGQLLHTDSYDNIFKNPDAFPNYDPAMNGWMKTEATLYMREIMRGEHGVHTMFSAPWSFVNEGLAPLYGVDVTGDAFLKTDLDPTQRAGILTLSGFLAAEADPRDPSSIHRGVFVDLSVLCIDLPPPPDDVTPLPPSDVYTTNRERVDSHTGAGTCGEGCHSTLINPPGFALEQFDALGQFRTTDNGFPVDASGSFRFAAGEATWDDAVGFASVLADNTETHRCYVRNWLEFLHGRTTDVADNALLDFMSERSRLEDRPVRELVLDIVTSDGFRHRVDAVEAN